MNVGPKLISPSSPNAINPNSEIQVEDPATETSSLIPKKSERNNIFSKCCDKLADLCEKCCCSSGSVSSCFRSVCENKGTLAFGFVVGASAAIGIMYAIEHFSKGGGSDNSIGPICEGMDRETIANLVNQMMQNTTEMVNNFLDNGTPMDPLKITECMKKYYPALQDFLNTTIQTAMKAANP